MGSLSIQKGKRAERDVANLINQRVEHACARVGLDIMKMKRNLQQSQNGGYDLIGIDWIAIEVKHCTKPAFNSWWAQTLVQAGDLIPVLWYKIHGGKWRVRVKASFSISGGDTEELTIVDLECEAFLNWLEKEIERRAACGQQVSSLVDPGMFDPGQLDKLKKGGELNRYKAPWEMT